ncbi:hypothetical protein FJY94_03745 [Candidatus Kaiserbacteria bacterium]|nr:hypothetical protein [Candidatus Kaiserbacteria bacterium]
MTMLTAYAPALLATALVLPLFAGLIAAFTRRTNLAVQSLFIISGAAGLAACVASFLSGTAVIVEPGILELSSLSVLFLAMLSFGTMLTSVFAVGYLPRHAEMFPARRVNSAMGFFLTGMTGVLVAQTLPAFLITWELMSIAAYFLIIADRSRESIAAGFVYFVMTQIGFASILSGMLILSGGNVMASWPAIAANTSRLPFVLASAGFFLAFAGFGSKAGLVPLHVWLPQAHPQAPSHASAMLSGVMLNVALYGFLRLMSFFADVPLSWILVIVAAGALSAFFGAVHAVTESDAKRLLAYSSIENMGLIFLGIGVMTVLRSLYGDPATAALASGAAVFVVLHIVNHFLFKTGLFMTVGAVFSTAHTRTLDELGGLARRLPILSAATLILSLAAGAMPPLGTFFGEWSFVQTLALAIMTLPLAYAAGAVIILSIVALVAGLALFASVKLFSVAFLGRARTPHAETAQPLPFSMVAPPVASALALVFSGIVALPLVTQWRTGFADDFVLASGARINTLWLLIIAVVLPVFLWSLRALLATRRERITDTWDCGQPVTPRMQYTATGFAAPLRFFFRAFVVTTKSVTRMPVVLTNRWIATHRLEWDISSVWERWIYASATQGTMRVAQRIRRLQNGVVQAYLLLLLIALIASILYAL